MIMTNTIKGAITVILFLCLLDIPYEYYRFVRIACTIGFAYLTYYASKNNIDNEIIPFVFLTLIFQPFATVELSKITWNVIDVIVGFGLIKNIKETK
jgi:hypothetical protein